MGFQWRRRIGPSGACGAPPADTAPVSAVMPQQVASDANLQLGVLPMMAKCGGQPLWEGCTGVRGLGGHCYSSASRGVRRACAHPGCTCLSFHSKILAGLLCSHRLGAPVLARLPTHVHRALWRARQAMYLGHALGLGATLVWDGRLRGEPSALTLCWQAPPAALCMPCSFICQSVLACVW